MKIIFSILVGFILSLSNVLANFSDLDKDALAEKFAPPHESDLLRPLVEELNSADGPKLLEKFLSDDRITKCLYSTFPHLNDTRMQDRLILVYLSDHAYWEEAHDGMRDYKPFMAAGINYHISKFFPELTERKEDNLALDFALQSPQGRDAIAAAYRKYLAIPPEKRTGDNPNVVGVMAEIRVALARYGTLEWLRKWPQMPKNAQIRDHHTVDTSDPKGNTNRHKITIKPAASESEKTELLPYGIAGGLALVAVVTLWLGRRAAKRQAPSPDSPPGI